MKVSILIERGRVREPWTAWRAEARFTPMPETADDCGAASPDDTTLAAAREKVANLERALEHRMDIGIACGILMERFGQDRETAFTTLKKISSHRNMKLRLVAEQLAAHGRLPAPPETAGEHEESPH